MLEMAWILAAIAMTISGIPLGLVYYKHLHVSAVSLPQCYIGNVEMWRLFRRGSFSVHVLLDAYVETLFVTLALCNAWTAIFNRDIYSDNAILRTFGSNNPCVGWDMAPISVVGALACGYMTSILFVAVILVVSQPHATHERVTTIATYIASASWCVLFIYTPDRNVYVHSSIFIFNVVCVAVFVNSKLLLHAADVQLSRLAVFIVWLFSIISFTLVFGMIASMSTRGPDSPVPTSPPAIISVVDWMWFVLLGLVVYLLPTPRFVFTLA